MKFKYSLAATAVASLMAGQAMAYTAAEVTALADLAPDTTWTAANWDSGISGATGLSAGTAWTDGTDPCGWIGVLCSGADITNIEVPNASMSVSGADLVAALTPMASTLQTLNISNTTASRNIVTGALGSMSSFTALTHLAVNNTDLTGEFPDMTGTSSLNWVNFSNNDLTSLGGKVAGGSAITFLSLENNENLVGDLDPTFASMDGVNAATVNTYDTKLFGAYPYKAGDAGDIRPSGVTPATAATTDNGAIDYVVADAILPVTGPTSSGGEGQATVSWVEPGAGAQNNYLVSYSSNGGTSWSAAETVAPGNTSHTFTELDAGSYLMRVQSTDGTLTGAIATAAAADVTAPVTPPPTTVDCPDGSTAPSLAECPDTGTSGGGGGAAVWLALPLIAAMRRRQA